MINDEENYQVIQPGYYLIDMGFKGTANDFNYSMMFNNILTKYIINMLLHLGFIVTMFIILIL